MEKSMDISTTTSASSNSDKTGDSDFDSWYDTTKAEVMDLSMSDDDFVKYISKEFSSTESSPEKRNALQQLINLRSQAVETISNALRLIMETSRSVIANIRP
jgi:hypothetical protein